jgi:hypothetical protein
MIKNNANPKFRSDPSGLKGRREGLSTIQMFYTTCNVQRTTYFTIETPSWDGTHVLVFDRMKLTELFCRAPEVVACVIGAKRDASPLIVG